MKYDLIVVEGTDASGKATQSKLLAERLRGTRFAFPDYETPWGKAILRHLKGEIVTLDGTMQGSAESGTITVPRAPEDALIFQAMCLANKCEAVPKMVGAAENGVVVADRWWPSSVVYGADEGLDGAPLKTAHAVLALPFTKTLYVFLDVPEAETLRRRPEARDRYERDREKQRRIRDRYLKLWKEMEWNTDWAVIDGVGSIGDVHDRILARLR